MSRMPLGDGPLIVQSDKTVLLDVAHPEAGAARAALAPVSYTHLTLPTIYSV